MAAVAGRLTRPLCGGTRRPVAARGSEPGAVRPSARRQRPGTPRRARPADRVREGGVEPPRPFGHTDLNRARLPIPPLAPEARSGYPTVRTRPKPTRTLAHRTGVLPAAPATSATDAPVTMRVRRPAVGGARARARPDRGTPERVVTGRRGTKGQDQHREMTERRRHGHAAAVRGPARADGLRSLRQGVPQRRPARRDRRRPAARGRQLRADPVPQPPAGPQHVRRRALRRTDHERLAPYSSTLGAGARPRCCASTPTSSTTSSPARSRSPSTSEEDLATGRFRVRSAAPAQGHPGLEPVPSPAPPCAGPT